MQDNEFKVYSFNGEENIDDFSSVLHDWAGRVHLMKVLSISATYFIQKIVVEQRPCILPELD